MAYPVLHYARPAAPRIPRRLFIAGAIVAAIVLSVGIGGQQLYVRWRQHQVARQAQQTLAALQARQQAEIKQRLAELLHQSAEYGAPATQVIFESDRDEAKKLLLQRESDYQEWDHAAWREMPAFWLELQQWTAHQTPAGYGLHELAIPFLHRREAPDGTVRTIRVKFGAIASGAFILQPEIVRLNDGHDGVVQACLGIYAPDPQRLRIMAGQADPKDSAHWTIACEVGGHPAIIDGWLDNFEVIRLVPRSGFVDRTRVIPLWFPLATAEEMNGKKPPEWPG